MAAKKDTAAYRRKMGGEQANPQSKIDKAYAEFKALSNDVERFRKVLDASKERVQDLENQLALAKIELADYEALLACSSRRLSIRTHVLNQELYKNEGIACGSPSSF